MPRIKIGILREEKVPVDHRAAITPAQAKDIASHYTDVEVVCQKSKLRCFSDDSYAANDISLVDKVDDCDVLFGVKEVPAAKLIADKTYFFFSHTIKKQAHNRELLRAVLAKNIRLIDYECLTDVHARRIIAFGRYAGIVGTYNGIWAYGKRYNLFHLRRAHACFDLEDLRTEYKKLRLPRIKIAITGGGRAAKGAMEVMHGMGIRRVSPAEFVSKYFDEPVFVQLNNRDYNKHKEGKSFNREEFLKHPENFEHDFKQFYQNADLLMAAAYWNPNAPVLFTREDMVERDFKIKVIADITCDIEGSIPSTLQASTMAEPLYDYDPTRGKAAQALSDEGNVTVMAVDNLPCELPRNASEDFGRELFSSVLPNLIGEDKDDIIKRATIAENGQLTESYAYLQDYVEGRG